MHVGYYGWNYGVGVSAPALLAAFAPVLVVLVLWSIFWKGLALWHSAQRGQYRWFVILLVVNTLGILELIYLFGVAKLRFDSLFSSRGH